MEAEPIGYCVQKAKRIHIEENIHKKIANGEKEDYEDIISKIEKFKHNTNEIEEESFYKINRILDGKRLFERLEHHNKLREDYRFLLARKIKEKGKVDIELIEIIDNLKESK